MRLICLAALAFIIGLTMIGCNPKSVDFDNLTVQDLKEGGFYAYVPPQKNLESAGFKQKIRMISFKAHCDASSMTSNPVNISYRNDEQNFNVGVSIAPNNSDWDSRQSSTLIGLDSKWIPSHQGSYQLTPEGGIILLFTDTFGMEVVVASKTEINKLVDFINKLEYVGPDPSEVTNPWQIACKQ